MSKAVDSLALLVLPGACYRFHGLETLGRAVASLLSTTAEGN
jgi:hypothetical protein